MNSLIWVPCPKQLCGVRLARNSNYSYFMSQVPFIENFSLCEIELVSKEGDAGNIVAANYPSN